jgi:nanoRNase/pAp phosphatase (c-di-AMP/oligoRNAs hydrolase)
VEGVSILINIDNRLSNNKSRVSFGAKPIPQEVVKSFEQKFLSAKTISLYSHSSLDEDTINSSKVIYRWLKKLGKDVSLCFNENETGGLFFKKSKNYKIKTDLTEKSGLDFFVDFNSAERVPKHYMGTFNPKTTIGFDHHTVTKTTILGRDGYIDDQSRSCSGIVYRFFEGIGVKLKKADLESLYCGMLSDYKKSKLISIRNTPDGHKLNKLQKLYEDTYSNEVLEKIESKLGPKSKEKILKHLDTLSGLTVKDKKFIKNIESKVQVTSNGELAYVAIDPADKGWKAVGMDNTKTSEMLSDLRSRLINPENDPSFSLELKNKLRDVKGAIVFYRAAETADSSYKMSIHAKDNYAERLINYIKNNLNPDLIAGGHPDRAGGKIRNCEKTNVDKFVNDFLVAAEAMK